MKPTPPKGNIVLYNKPKKTNPTKKPAQIQTKLCHTKGNQTNLKARKLIYITPKRPKPTKT
jgi:hypothetical protein